MGTDSTKPNREPASLGQFGTALLTDCLGRFGAMTGAIRRFAGDGMAGPAVTVEVAAGENGTIHRALATASAGDVLVVAAGGGVDRAVWGGVLARAALARGLAGVVIDGAVRDVDDLVAIGLPTFASASTPLGPHKGWPGRVGFPVACSGVVVQPGDVVVGDSDGVAVIPADRIDEIHRLAEARRTVEEEWLRRIALGESTVEILGLDSE